jgi:hypothetical protein
MSRTTFSTSTALALAAVLLSSTTTVFAVSALPKHSVGTKQLKTSAVTTKKIANRVVTGSKMKPNTLGATQIRESSLGQVPSAASAVNATQLDGKTASAFVGAGRLAFGKGTAASTTATTVLTLPNLGVTVTTDGDSDTSAEVEVILPSTAPSFSWAVAVEGSAMFSTMGGSPLSLTALAANSYQFSAHIWRLDTSDAFLLHCAFDGAGFTSARPLVCWASSS